MWDSVFFLSSQVCALEPLDTQPDNNDPDDILEIDILDIVISPAARPAEPVMAAPLASTEEISPALTEARHTTAGSEWSGYAFPLPAETAGEEEGGAHWFGVMVREVVETVGLAVIIFLIIRIGIQNYRIEGASMEPNFHDGEYLIVNKLAYRLGEYERGDVIVFKYPNDPSKDYIKRVIGLPGDTVEIRGGELYVNNTLINEPYPHMPNVRDEPPTVVEAGHLYVMGDNRPASSDTRSWGQLGQEFVIGQAWLAIYPINQFGLVEHQPIEVNAVMAQGP